MLLDFNVKCQSPFWCFSVYRFCAASQPVNPGGKRWGSCLCPTRGPCRAGLALGFADSGRAAAAVTGTPCSGCDRPGDVPAERVTLGLSRLGAGGTRQRVREPQRRWVSSPEPCPAAQTRVLVLPHQRRGHGHVPGPCPGFHLLLQAAETCPAV